MCRQRTWPLDEHVPLGSTATQPAAAGPIRDLCPAVLQQSDTAAVLGRCPSRGAVGATAATAGDGVRRALNVGAQYPACRCHCAGSPAASAIQATPASAAAAVPASASPCQGRRLLTACSNLQCGLLDDVASLLPIVVCDTADLQQRMPMYRAFGHAAYVWRVLLHQQSDHLGLLKQLALR